MDSQLVKANATAAVLEEPKISSRVIPTRRSRKFLRRHGEAIGLGHAAINNDKLVKFLERHNDVALTIAPRSNSDSAIINTWLSQTVSPHRQTTNTLAAPASPRRLNVGVAQLSPPASHPAPPQRLDAGAAEVSPLPSPRRLNAGAVEFYPRARAAVVNLAATASSLPSAGSTWDSSSNDYVDYQGVLEPYSTSTITSPRSSNPTTYCPFDFDDDFDGWGPVRRDRRSYGPSVIDRGGFKIFGPCRGVFVLR